MNDNRTKNTILFQIHPQGWCALSRNISHNDKSEVILNMKLIINYILMKLIKQLSEISCNLFNKQN